MTIYTSIQGMVTPSGVDGDVLVEEKGRRWQVCVRACGKWHHVGWHDGLKKANSHAELLQRRFNAWREIMQ